MAIPVTEVSPTIVAFVQQVKDALCKAKDMGVDLELGEELRIRVAVIAPIGPNSIQRIVTQNTGEQVQVTENPERTETQLVGEGLQTNNSGEGVSTTLQTDNSPVKTTRNYAESHTDTTTRQSTPSTTHNDQTQTTTQQSSRSAGGGNTVTEVNEYSTL